MINLLIDHHHNHSLKLLKIILIFLDLLLLLFKTSVSGQLLDIGDQNSIIINDKLYFLGGESFSAGDINQILYLDLSKLFQFNQSLSIKLLTPTPTVQLS